MNWIDKTYSGKERLSKVFWLGYALPLIPIAIATRMVLERMDELPEWLLFALGVAVFLYNAWLVVSLWRCAPNSSRRTYYFLGRAFSVVLGISLFAAAMQLLRGAP